MRKLVLFFCFAMLLTRLNAQTDSLATISQEDLLESFAQGQDEESAFDYNDIFERLDYLRRRPLHLNKATETDLADFPFLNELQRAALLEYRRTAGDFISIYELQAVPGYDIATIRQLLPYVQVTPPGILNEPIFGENRESRSQLLMRWARTLEARRGFTVSPEDTASNRYLGDRNRLYLRYRYSQNNRFSFGITAEKDAGEEFFKGSNKQGFDFYSAHLFLQNPVRRVKALALGDFSVSMGQGLLVFQGFAPRKSALTTNVKRTGRNLRPYSSVNEIDFFRGVAAVTSVGKNLELLTFASQRRRDANFVEPEELSPDEPVVNFVSSLQTSGLHRTRTEIADENAIRQTSAGATLNWQKRRFHIALNGLYEHLDKPLQRNPALYNQFYFNGNQLLNFSADYAFTFQNLHFFGETARSDNGALATLNGLLIALDRRIDLVLLHRDFSKEYQSLNPKPFAESSGGTNEKGIYIGLQVQPSRQWRFNGYYDLYKHPWLRFQVDAPSSGYEWLARVTYTQRRKMEAYFQLRQEIKEQNADAEHGKFDELVFGKLFQARFHLSYQISKSLEWRSRLDAGFFEQAGQKSTGVVLYQDLIYRAIGTPVSFSTRFAIFDTDGYDVRYYAYERDVLNDFSIPAYYDRGARFYLNMGYRLGRQWRIEVRYARSYFTNLEKIGSGLDEITGQSRSDVKVQMRWEF
jgi:hypothetical protein